MDKTQPAHARRSLPRRLVNILLKTLLTILIILLLVFFLVQTPFVQDIIRGKAENYLSRKLKTRVRIGSLHVAFFTSITLKKVYIEDLQKDTLLSAGLIDVDVRMLGLLHNDLDIKRVQLENLTIKLKRQLPDTAFNFQFIVDAFSGPPSSKAGASPSKPMKMGLQTLALDKIRFVYKDTVTGNDMEIWVGHSLARMDGMDLAHLRFDIPRFELEGLQARIYQGKPIAGVAAASKAAAPASNTATARSGPPPAAPSSSADTASTLLLNLDQIDLKNSALDYRNTVNNLSANVNLGRLIASVQRCDVDRQIFQLKQVQIDSTNVRFDGDKRPRQKAGMDYMHLLAKNLSFRATGLSYSPDSVSGSIVAASFAEQSGFRLTRLQTKFFYSDRRAWLKDLILQTPGTQLQRAASLQYVSMARIMKDPAHTLIDLDLPNSRVQVKDILTFVPSLAAQPAFSHPENILRINAKVRGTLDALTIQSLQFSGIGDIRLDVAGRIIHPLDSRRLQTDLAIRNLSGSREAVINLLPQGSFPQNIEIPEHFSLSGKLAGTMDAMQSELVLTTSSGTVLLKGWARDMRSRTAASYDLHLQTHELDLGHILRDSLQWGKVTAAVAVKGQGLDIHTANAAFNGHISEATFRQYRYRDIGFDGSLAHQHAELHSSANDSAVRFELKASADLENKFPALQLDWQIDTLDLLALHFVKDTLSFKGHILAGFADTNPDSLQGALKLTGVNVLYGAQRLATDSIIFVATRRQDIQDIQLHSEMADLDWNGRYKLTETAQALQHTLNSYYHLNGYKDSAFTPQDWTMRLQFRASPLALVYMPSLKGTDSLGGLVTFNSNRNDLHLELKAPHIQFGSQQFEQLNVTAATGDGRLDYDLQIAGGTGSGFELHKTWLAGALRDNRLTTALVMEDNKGKKRFRLAGELDKSANGLKFVFNPDSLLLNYDAWKVKRDNFIRYDSSGIVAHDFVISHTNDSLSVNSRQDNGTSPIDIHFTNFSLATISHLVDQDSLLIDGILNGKAEIKNVLTKPVFTSDLQIHNLSYKSDTVGDLAIKVNNDKANALTADISLEGKNNDIKVKGDYALQDGRVNMQLDLGQLDLATFGHAAPDEIERMKGYLKGKLAIAGTLDQPQVKGNLHFDSSVITPVISGEPLRLSKDNIEFDETGFNFSKFSLQDSAGNKLIIDGNVYTKDYRNYGFDLSVNASNFRLVNAQESGSRQFYGSLNMDAAVNLEGDMNSPKVDGDLRVNKKTNFYFIMPSSDPEVVNRLGVVRFVDKDHPGDTLVDRAAQLLKSRQTGIRGTEVSLNLQTDSNAVFTMVIDERTGDELTVRGRSNLVFGMDKSGKTDLTGSFEVESGSYNLSLDVLKRKFAIERGSIITWTGDPMTATLTLTASYTAVTPSIDLISNEIAGRPQTDINKFKEKLPFLVTLKMEGDLLKPKITFDITLPPNILSLWPDVDTKLQQIRNEESELNKQVFALLLLNRFVGEDPLQSAAGGGSSVGSMAFQSASQILTSQLDQLAASLIKGVDIHFGLNNEQDYSTGNEIDYTELNVSVSKRLFNDRVTVNVGSNFDVQGTGAPNQNASNFAGDVSVDYKLSKDGRYMLRAYQQNQYEAVVEGQVVETGLSFILTFDYNRLKELFRKTQDEQLTERKVSKPAGGKSTNK